MKSLDDLRRLKSPSPTSGKPSLALLRPLTDEEFEEARGRSGSVPLTTCPTCKSVPETIPDSGGLKERPQSQYKLYGELHDCDCETQIKLRRAYLAANIGDQYQELNWDDYQRDQEVRDAVASYLTSWEAYRDNGIGLSFTSRTLGTGKTFAATYVGKELIKKAQRVFFIMFVDMVSAFERDGDRLEAKMKSIHYLLLDDVLKPFTERQRDFYALRLESIIRHRTNFNLPTIITTNLDADELEQWYPRTFSLLSLKNIEVKMTGNDARQAIHWDLKAIAQNGEKRPVT